MMCQLSRGKIFMPLMPLIMVACTNINVKKATSDTVAGIRYALPRPFIQVTPEADGSVTVKQVYLPDMANTYAIDAAAYASSLTLDISIVNGLLTKVEMKRDSAAVAEQAVKTAGEVGSKVLESESKRQAAQQTKIEAANTQVKLQEEAVATAKLDVELAQIDKDSADGGKDEAAKEKTRVALEKAKAKLKAAEEKLNRLRSARGALSSALAGEGPPSQSASKHFKVRGPVLYAVEERVEDGTPIVSLMAVKIDGASQKSYGTVTTGGSTRPEARLRIAKTTKQRKEVYLIEHSSQDLTLDDIKELKFFRDSKKERPLSDDAAEKIRKAASVKNEVIEIPVEEIDGAKVSVIEVGGASGLIPTVP